VRPFLSSPGFSADVVRNDCFVPVMPQTGSSLRANRLATHVARLSKKLPAEIVFVIVEGILLVLLPPNYEPLFRGLTWSLEWHDHANVFACKAD
jgi:hypothetical protein